jgi:hypothetical protein
LEFVADVCLAWHAGFEHWFVACLLNHALALGLAKPRCLSGQAVVKLEVLVTDLYLRIITSTMQHCGATYSGLHVINPDMPPHNTLRKLLIPHPGIGAAHITVERCLGNKMAPNHWYETALLVARNRLYPSRARQSMRADLRVLTSSKSCSRVQSRKSQRAD